MPEEIPVILMELPPNVSGFVCLGSDFNPCIILNSRLPVEQQRKTWQHEMDHLLNGEFDDDSYSEFGDAV